MEDNFKNNGTNKIFCVGISLTNSSNYDSGIVILDKNKKIMSLDKFYTTDDLDLFFKNYISINETVFCVTLPSDGTLIDGKWRMHSKNYKLLDENFEINKNDWTNRISKRGCDILSEVKKRGAEIYRCDINQLRLGYKVAPTYALRSSLDCKNLQTALRMKYGFRQLPENMMPASNLEAVLAGMLAYDILNGEKTHKASEFMGLDVLHKILN